MQIVETRVSFSESLIAESARADERFGGAVGSDQNPEKALEAQCGQVMCGEKIIYILV